MTKASTFICLFCLSFFSLSLLYGHDLVDLQMDNPTIQVDFRYATSNNFLGCPLYTCDRIFINRHVSSRLKRVQKDLANLGIGLIVHEGYRPPSVQQFINSGFCSDCQSLLDAESEHYRKGLGVDVSICYLEGCPLALPTDYDEVSPASCRDCNFLPGHVYHNSALLEKYMVMYGFVPQREKWWHFDLHGWDYCENLTLEYRDLLNFGAN